MITKLIQTINTLLFEWVKMSERVSNSGHRMSFLYSTAATYHIHMRQNFQFTVLSFHTDSAESCCMRKNPDIVLMLASLHKPLQSNLSDFITCKMTSKQSALKIGIWKPNQICVQCQQSSALPECHLLHKVGVHSVRQVVFQLRTGCWITKDCREVAVLGAALRFNWVL